MNASSAEHIVERWYEHFGKILKRDMNSLAGVMLPREWLNRVPEGATEIQAQYWKTRCRETLAKFTEQFGNHLPPR